MNMSKLTLNVDKAVLARARRYAKKRGVSVSQIVREYLDVVAGAAAGSTFSAVNPSADDGTPVLRSLRGILKSANLQNYREHLVAKYR
jgi:hypothetical protein